MITENTILTPAQQKQLVIKEVVKKHLKEAGFKSVGQTFYLYKQVRIDSPK